MNLRKASGRMFKSVDFCGTYFQGCDHGCVYCWGNCLPWPISHEPKLLQKNEYEILKVRDAIIFLNSAHDSFANCIPNELIYAMLRWISRQDPSNKFLLQTKNPTRMSQFLNQLLKIKDRIRLGTTLETTEDTSKYSNAPHPQERAFVLSTLKQSFGFETFLSLEPLMDFNLEIMIRWIREIKPICIEVGLDNYEWKHGTKLPKPSKQKYVELKKAIIDLGILLKEKDSIIKWLEEN